MAWEGWKGSGRVCGMGGQLLLRVLWMGPCVSDSMDRCELKPDEENCSSSTCWVSHIGRVLRICLI